MMNPTAQHLLCFVIVNMVLIISGYGFARRTMVWQSWFSLVCSVLIIHYLFVDEHPILRMLALIATAFTAMKAIATASSDKNNLPALPFRQWLPFSMAWAGMRAQAFETLGQAALPESWSKIRFGISRLFAGAGLIVLAHELNRSSLHPDFLYPAISMILLIAFSLILHFGILSIAAGIWRLAGARTYYLFKAPLKSKTLNDFWSRRWNLAFSEMTSIAIFRPLKNKVGGEAALLIAFIFSGLLHELALSIPVNSGYGLPLLYFVIQGIGILAEKAMLHINAGWLEHRLLGKVWLLVWLVLPTPLLFHENFIQEIIWPLAGIHPKG